ncbi:MAG TPA: hypothetical protein PK114_07085 [Smithellaceae bacterium]|nr:hypothetical protein [Smithellaceae bacterium]
MTFAKPVPGMEVSCFTAEAKTVYFIGLQRDYLKCGKLVECLFDKGKTIGWRCDYAGSVN